MKAGIFITLEGLDGAGKSTHLSPLAEFWRARGCEVVTTREPGGTPFGEQLRALLLDPEQKIDSETEVLLIFAARREHLTEVIEPALARGAVVISDRFTDATFAYQGGGRGIDWKKLKTLEQWVQGDLQPHLTLLFDVAPEVARSRAAGARVADRFEQEQLDFFTRVREGYLRRAKEAPHRIRIVDAGIGVEGVRQEVLAMMQLFLELP